MNFCLFVSISDSLIIIDHIVVLCGLDQVGVSQKDVLDEFLCFIHWNRMFQSSS